jgi:pSer/pThr/pTyr-binding forkhead associated (FHA) protein
MNIKLVSLDHGVSDFEFAFDKLPIRMGRHHDAEVKLPDPWTSRFHCEIDQINGTVSARDLRSKNGVYVNGLRVAETLIMPGDRLTVGISSFRICYDREASPSPSAVDSVAAGA